MNGPAFKPAAGRTALRSRDSLVESRRITPDSAPRRARARTTNGVTSLLPLNVTGVMARQPGSERLDTARQDPIQVRDTPHRSTQTGTPVRAVVIAGNPKPQSRTLDAGKLLAARLGAGNPQIIDVVDLGPGLLGWGDPAVKAAIATVQEADLAIFASPTYKASYTGLLKLFLDQFATGDGLKDVTAIPLMLGGGLAHYLAPELLLKPVLVELGAICPVPGVYQLDKNYADDPALDVWVERWLPVINTLTERNN